MRRMLGTSRRRRRLLGAGAVPRVVRHNTIRLPEVVVAAERLLRAGDAGVLGTLVERQVVGSGVPLLKQVVVDVAADGARVRGKERAQGHRGFLLVVRVSWRTSQR